MEVTPKKSTTKPKKSPDFIKLVDIKQVSFLLPPFLILLVQFGYNFTKKKAATFQDIQSVHLLQQLLNPDNSSRISADNALKLRFFR